MSNLKEKLFVPEVLDAPDLPPRVILDLAIHCNLRCPMCPVWGSEDNDAIESVRGVMDKEGAKRLIDELQAAKPLIHPALYGEPLLAPDFEEVVGEALSRGFPVSLNTNGLALSDKLMEFILSSGVGSIMFSIDATTAGTLKKVRGIENLEKIHKNVARMLNARGDKTNPRIGVSFTSQDDNKHELDEFVEHWIEIVDVVRVGNVFIDGKFEGIPDQKERKACPVIYETMAVHNDGTVSICCLDSFRETNMGNVFEDGVQGVWKGEKFEQARRWHESGELENLPICQNCNGWIQHEYEEKIENGVLIRRSPEFTYYNRIERLDNWQGTLRGGHQVSSIE